jgi:hypothetical protein
MSPQMSESRAWQMLRTNIGLWADLNVRIQFLKDWVKAPPRVGAREVRAP